MYFNEWSRVRCDSCGKWFGDYELFTLPEDCYPHLECDNEFIVCDSCSSKRTVDEWLKWIPKGRKKLEERIRKQEERDLKNQ
jgi:hypothetical protein